MTPGSQKPRFVPRQGTDLICKIRNSVCQKSLGPVQLLKSNWLSSYHDRSRRPPPGSLGEHVSSTPTSVSDFTRIFSSNALSVTCSAVTPIDPTSGNELRSTRNRLYTGPCWENRRDSQSKKYSFYFRDHGMPEYSHNLFHVRTSSDRMTSTPSKHGEKDKGFPFTSRRVPYLNLNSNRRRLFLVYQG